MAEITEKNLKEILREQRKEYQRYIDILYKKFQSDIKVLGEDLSAGIAKNAEGIAGNAEMIAKNAENIEIIKSDIQFIKQELRHKVDRDEFETLEKRVMLLERKFTPA